MTADVSCVFCDIISGVKPRSVVWENDDVLVIPDIHPRAPVHLLVIPKIHVADAGGMSRESREAFVDACFRVIREQRIRNWRLVHNGGGAQQIRHAHMHIMGSVSRDRDL